MQSKILNCKKQDALILCFLLYFFSSSISFSLQEQTKAAHMNIRRVTATLINNTNFFIWDNKEFIKTKRVLEDYDIREYLLDDFIVYEIKFNENIPIGYSNYNLYAKTLATVSTKPLEFTKYLCFYA